MENYIEHGDTMDVIDIAGYIREAAETIEAAEDDPETVAAEELEEAKQALSTYRKALAELTGQSPVEDWRSLASDWEELDEGTLIAEGHFPDYAIDLMEDIGAIPEALPWYVVIDKEATAAYIKADYSEVEIDGVNYLIRLM